MTTRAFLVFGLILSLFVLNLGLGLYIGVESGEINNIKKPFESISGYISDIAKNLSEDTQQTPSSTSQSITVELSSSPSSKTEINIRNLVPSPTPKPTPPLQKGSVSPSPSLETCIQYKIREGEFVSDKCYSQKDYDDLLYYLQRYNSSVFNRDGATESIKITCKGSDFFKQSCEDDKKRLAEAEADIVKYRDIIRNIILKGK